MAVAPGNTGCTVPVAVGVPTVMVMVVPHAANYIQRKARMTRQAFAYQIVLFIASFIFWLKAFIKETTYYCIDTIVYGLLGM